MASAGAQNTWENMLAFFIDSIQMPGDLYEDLNGSLIR